jgi:hypothetical protein
LFQNWTLITGKSLHFRNDKFSKHWHIQWVLFCSVHGHHTVTYSGVLFTMELYCSSKSQHTTVKHSQKLFRHMYTSNPYGLGTHSYRILPTGPLVAIFQHSLPFLQSESFQTRVGTIHRRAIGPLAHHNGTSAYSPSLTCTRPDDRMSSPSTV